MSDAVVFFRGWAMDVSSQGISCGGDRFEWHEISRTVRKIEAPSLLNDYIFGAIGGVLVLVGFSGATWALVVGGLLLLFSIFEAKVSKRPEYVFFIETPTGLHEIYRCKSPTKAAELEDALRQAPTARSA